MLVSLMESRRPLSQLPRDPLISMRPDPRPVMLLMSLIIPPATFLIAVAKMSRTANIPLNVDLIWGPYFSVHSLNVAVRSLTLSVTLINCSEVTGGNISLNASLTGLTMFIKASKAFLTASIAAARPPFSAHSPTTLLRASEDLLIMSLSVSETLVQSFLASSKSPTMYSQV